MLLKLLWKLIWGKTPRGGYSLRGFWGEIRHFDKDGKQIGYTIKGFWGRRKRYDMNGKLLSYSVKNFWGGYNTYDPEGNLIRKSRKNFWGGYTTFDRYGNKITESYKNFWGGYNHYDVEKPDFSGTFILVEPQSDKMKKTTFETKTVTYKQQKLTNQNTGEVKKIPYENETKKNVVMGERKEKKVEKNSNIEKKVQMQFDKERIVQVKSTDRQALEKRDKEPEYKYCSKDRIDETIRYLESFVESVEGEEDKQPCAKILAFSYGELKEFPAYVYDCGDEFKVVPLIEGKKSFVFDKMEIKEAKKTSIAGLNMEILDTEFSSFGVSKLSNEFAELFPEYEYTMDGISRVQYELKNGLIITENSWIALNRII